MSSHVVVLGGGFGGINAAIELKKLAGDLADVTVVDRARDFYMGLSKLWVATGRRTAGSCMRSRDELSRHGVRFVQADIAGIDADAKTVETSTGSVSYDRLVIALGLDVDPTLIPGLDENGLNLYSMTGAEKVSNALESASGDVLIVICAVPFKCPPGPYEAAMMIDERLKERGADARVEVVTPEPRPMPILPAENGERVAAFLEERGIAYTREHKLVAVEPSIARFENGAERRFDLLIAVPPHKAPAFLADVPGLTEPPGLVGVDRYTLLSGIPGVYAIGDVAKVMSFTDLPIPRAGILAEAQARVVAANITAELRGSEPAERFDGRGYCFLEVGGGRALRLNGDFLAQPHPVADAADRPSADDYADKLAFEAERLEAWFGPA